MGEENENSEKLLSFCTSHKLLVGGTWFQHRQVHRYTYNPPNPSCLKKMLDHILFAERQRMSDECEDQKRENHNYRS